MRAQTIRTDYRRRTHDSRCHYYAPSSVMRHGQTAEAVRSVVPHATFPRKRRPLNAVGFRIACTAILKREGKGFVRILAFMR